MLQWVKETHLPGGSEVAGAPFCPDEIAENAAAGNVCTPLREQRQKEKSSVD